MSDYDNIRNALNYLDPNDRDFWIRIGAAIKDHQGEEGFTLWDDWSRHSDSYKPSDAKAVWKSLKPGHIRINTLFYHARENGYRPEKPYTPPTAEELAARQAAARARRAEAERQEIQQREKARRTAGYIWTQAAPADPSHPYLKSKGINNPVLLSGIRQNEYKGSLNLVVPVYHEGRLANIQTIGADGGKRFLNGGQVKGGYSVVGSVDDMAKGLVIAEGFATAASIHAATGRPVIVAFNAGNMVAVAEKLAQTLPQNVPVTIAADNDASQTGIQKAREAAALLGSRARTVQPEFTMTQIRDYQRGRSGSDTPPLPSDFNDLYLLAGIEAVRAQMAAALPTPERQPENLPSLSRRVAPDEIRTQAEVLQGQPVARLEENQLGMPTDGGMKAVKEWADLVFKRQGSAAVHPALGKITLDRRGINDSLGHGNFNPYKNLAFAAVKDVLERGTLVAADYSRKDEHSYYVSAPVDINGKANILTAVAHLDANTQRMYLHSVILKENLLHLHVSKTKKNESPERLSVPDAADEDILLQGSDSVKKNPGGSRKHPDGITSLQVRNLISDALAHKLHPEQEQNIAQQPERQLVNEKKVREFLTTHPLQLHRDITSKTELSSRDIKTEGDLAQWRNARRQPETTQVSETPRPEAAAPDAAAFSMPAANAAQTKQEQHMAQQPERQTETPTQNPPHPDGNDIFAYEIREQDGRHYAVFTDTFGKLFNYPVVPAQGAQTAQEAAEAADYTVNLYQNDNFISTAWQSEKGQAKVYGWANLPTFLPVKTGREPQYGVRYENNGYPKSVGYRSDIERMMQRDALQLAEKQAEAAARQPVNDWLAQSGLSAIQAGRARSVLDKRIDYRDYGEMTRADFIRERIAEGWTTRRGTDARSGKPTLGIWSPDGSTGYDITETEKQFADWLAQRQQPEYLQPAQETAMGNPAPEKQPENPTESSAPSVDPEWEQTVADQRRLDSERRAERAPWRDFPPVIRNGGLGSLKNEPEYAAAKGGDDIEAGRLVNKLLKEETVQQFREMIGDRKPVIVSVSATESAGRNKIPLAMAQALGSRLDLPVDTDIQQINKVSRTGSGIDHRLAFQPVFDGHVEAGRDYLIVDDTLAVGGTVAALRGYIENRGGHVVGAGVMTAHEGALNLPVKQAMIDNISRKHGNTMDNYWKEEFGYGIDQLTQGEAGHLNAARDVEQIRDRIAEARLQGIARPTEQTLPLSPGQQERPDGIAPEPNQAAAPDAAAFSMPAENAKQAEQEKNMAQQPEKQPENITTLYNSIREVLKSNVSDGTELVFNNDYITMPSQPVSFEYRKGNHSALLAFEIADGKLEYEAHLMDETSDRTIARDSVDINNQEANKVAILFTQVANDYFNQQAQSKNQSIPETRQPETVQTATAVPISEATGTSSSVKQEQNTQTGTPVRSTLADEISALGLSSDLAVEYQTLTGGREIARIRLAGFGGELMVDKIEAEKGGGYVASSDAVLGGMAVRSDNLPNLMREMTFQMRQSSERSRHKEQTAVQPERPSESSRTQDNRAELKEKAAKALDTAGDIMDAAALAAGAATGNFVGAAALVAASRVAEHAAGKLMEDMDKQAEKVDAASRRQEQPAPSSATQENGIEYGGSRTQDAARAEPETITIAEVQENLRSIRMAESRAATASETPPEIQAQQARERPSENARGTPADSGREARADTGRPSETPTTETQQEQRTQPKPVLDLNYETAAGLDARYVRYDGRYLDPNNARTVLFEDKGAKIKTAREDGQTISDMLDTAQAKNWDSIRISGSHEFKRQMWLEAELRGIPNSGYSPSKEDLAMRDQMRETRERNSIEAGGLSRTGEAVQRPSERQSDPERTQTADSPSQEEEPPRGWERVFDDDAPLPSTDTAAVQSAAAEARAAADTPAEYARSEQMQGEANMATVRHNGLHGQAAAANRERQPESAALQSARAVYMQKAEKLSKTAKAQLAFYEKNMNDVFRHLDGPDLNRAMTRYYESTAERMKGSHLDMPRPTQIPSQEQKNATATPAPSVKAGHETDHEIDR